MKIRFYIFTVCKNNIFFLLAVMKKSYIIILSFILLNSCQKAKDCFSNSGKEIVIEQELANFDSLYVNDVFEVKLIQDTINSISIKGHEKFVNSTIFNIEDNTLILENEHKCKFAKPKSNAIYIDIHVKEISFIRLNGSSKVFSKTELINDNEIGLVATSKYNDADLIVNSKVFYFWNNHLNGGKIKVKGKVETLKLWNTSLASVDASKLIAKNVLVDNNSKGDCKIQVSNKLDCKITGTGNVYYYGAPKTIIYNDTLSIGGQLLFGGQYDY